MSASYYKSMYFRKKISYVAVPNRDKNIETIKLKTDKVLPLHITSNVR